MVLRCSGGVKPVSAAQTQREFQMRLNYSGDAV
jgi:hypothetical protein